MEKRGQGVGRKQRGSKYVEYIVSKWKEKNRKHIYCIVTCNQHRVATSQSSFIPILISMLCCWESVYT